MLAPEEASDNESSESSSEDSEEGLTVAERLAQRTPVAPTSFFSHKSTPAAGCCDFCGETGERKAWGCVAQSLRCEQHAALRCSHAQCRSKTPTTGSKSGSKSLRVDAMFRNPAPNPAAATNKTSRSAKQHRKGVSALFKGHEGASPSATVAGASPGAAAVAGPSLQPPTQAAAIVDLTADDEPITVTDKLMAQSSSRRSIKPGNSVEKSKLRYKSMERSKCLICKKALQRVGTDRANGVRHHGDWAKRQYHKKCLKAHPELAADSNWIKTFYN